MKHSIRRQMAGCFIGVMAATLFCCYLVNQFFLESYYVENKKKTIVGAYLVLNKGVSQGRIEEQEFISELDQICVTDNISIFVMDTSGNPRIYTNRDYKTLQRKLIFLR